MKPFVEGTTPLPERVYYNGKYQVHVKEAEDQNGRPMKILSIRREDRKAIMDWRDLQWIKNWFLGPEAEAVQLFPAESRLVDTANQYYLHGYTESFWKFPFGFQERSVSEKVHLKLAGHGASQQRPFAEHVKPADLKGQERRVHQILKDTFEKE